MGRGFMNPSHPEELTRAAKAPEVSELRYRRLFETARDGILILDAETGRVVDANPFLVRLLGYSHEQFVGKAIWELGFLRDVLANRDKFRRVAAPGIRSLREPAAGGRRWPAVARWNSSATSIWKGSKKVIQCNIRDITERARMESSLKESASFLNTLLEAMPVPVFYKDVEGRYTGVNRAFETFFGKTRAELVGKTVFDIAPHDLAELYHARDLELFHKPGMQVYEAKVKDAKGGCATWCTTRRPTRGPTARSAG
jgi:PAS domain S-box-containing protein